MLIRSIFQTVVHASFIIIIYLIPDVITLSSDEEAEEGDEHLMLTPNRWVRLNTTGNSSRK